VTGIAGGLAVLVPWIIICRACAKRTEAMAELIEALDRYPRRPAAQNVDATTPSDSSATSGSRVCT
jgi:hypothetical protein